MNIAVFVSGDGSNLQALIDAQKQGNLEDGRIILVVSSKEDAFAVERSRKAGIKTFALDPSEFSSRTEYDMKISAELDKEQIDLIVLAGFMRVLSSEFIKKHEGKIVNVHPSLLPAFKGVHGIKEAFEYGVKVTGVTVHFVIDELDAGPVMLQETVCVEEDDTLESLEEKIHTVEHRIYPEAVRLIIENKLLMNGRKIWTKK